MSIYLRLELVEAKPMTKSEFYRSIHCIFPEGENIYEKGYKVLLSSEELLFVPEEQFHKMYVNLEIKDYNDVAMNNFLSTSTSFLSSYAVKFFQYFIKEDKASANNKYKNANTGRKSRNSWSQKLKSNSFNNNR